MRMGVDSAAMTTLTRQVMRQTIRGLTDVQPPMFPVVVLPRRLAERFGEECGRTIEVGDILDLGPRGSPVEVGGLIEKLD